MIMKRPTATAASVHHFLFSGVKSRALTVPRLEKARVFLRCYPYACARARVRLDTRPGTDRERQPDAARPEARGGTLCRPPPRLRRGARPVLAGPDRGPRPGVLPALD